MARQQNVYILIGENRFFEELPIQPKTVSKHSFIGLFHWGMGFCSNGAKSYPPTLSLLRDRARRDVVEPQVRYDRRVEHEEDAQSQRDDRGWRVFYTFIDKV